MLFGSAKITGHSGIIGIDKQIALILTILPILCTSFLAVYMASFLHFYFNYALLLLLQFALRTIIVHVCISWNYNTFKVQ